VHEPKQEQKLNQNKGENNHRNEQSKLKKDETKSRLESPPKGNKYPQVNSDARGLGPDADDEEQNVTAKSPSDRQQPLP